MTKRRKHLIIIQAAAGFAIVATYAILLSISCAGGGGDPTGAVLDFPGEQDGVTVSAGDLGAREGSGEKRVVWGGYVLDIRPEAGQASVRPWERGLEGHFNVTGFVTRPACPDCVQLHNFSFDRSAGVIDLDAQLINPTQVGGYDVRGVLLLDEWGTGRRLESAHGLTDFWSKDPYHPDPFINFARENPDRCFGPQEQHSAHVTLTLPEPYNLLVPFIVDACWPDHPPEPVEMMNISVTGSIHPTGYDFGISLDLLDWQDDAAGVYLDCSPLNMFAGWRAFHPPDGAGSSTWTIDLVYDPTNPSAWLPTAEGEVELPLVATDPETEVALFQRVAVDVIPDTEPPQWTGEVGVDEIWWGGSRAVISYFPAVDPSGPVLYNIYYTTDVPLIPAGKETLVAWSHYTVQTVDGAAYEFVVRAEDQAGNEDENEHAISGMTTQMSEIWERVFSADLDSSPTVRDIDSDGVEDVIFGCDDGAVYSLAGGTGEVQWSYQTEAMVKSTPALRDVNDDGLMDVVVGSNDSTIYAISLFMGSPVPFRTFPTANIVESSPVCADQTGDGVPEVVVGSFDNKLYAFEGGTGDLLVEYDTGAPVKATPSLEDFNSDGHLDVVVASGGVVRAVNGITGTSLWYWDFETGFSLGSPAIGDLNGDGIGDVVLGSGGGVYAFDVANESLIWANQSLAGNLDTSPALGDFTGDGVPDVVISSRYMNVYLLDGSDGSLIWVSHDGIYMPTFPSLGDVNADGIIDVVVGAADFKLRVLNGADGFTLYSWNTGSYGAVTTVPLIADVDSDGDIDIVFGTDSHRMIAVTTGHPVPVDLDLLPWPKFMRTRSNTGNLDHPLY